MRPNVENEEAALLVFAFVELEVKIHTSEAIDLIYSEVIGGDD